MATDDRRERILVRLLELLVAVAAANTAPFYAWRDRAELDDMPDENGVMVLPAYVLLDGGETKLTTATTSLAKRAPGLMLLQPQIFYVPLPTSTQRNEGVGEALSEHRNKLLRAIMFDGSLSDLLGDSGYIEYRGMETDMQTGAEVKGQFRMDLALAYTLNFNKL